MSSEIPFLTVCSARCSFAPICAFVHPCATRSKIRRSLGERLTCVCELFNLSSFYAKRRDYGFCAAGLRCPYVSNLKPLCPNAKSSTRRVARAPSGDERPSTSWSPIIFLVYTMGSRAIIAMGSRRAKGPRASHPPAKGAASSFRSGFRTFGRPSSKPRTVSHWRWRRALTRDGTRHSSTQFPPGLKNEAWRDQDRLGWCGTLAKPRPAVIIQDDRFEANDSTIACPLTTDTTEAPTFRLSVQPSSQTGLRLSCRMIVDTLTAVPKRRLGRLVGSLTSEEVKTLNRAIFVFLGLSETRNDLIPTHEPNEPSIH